MPMGFAEDETDRALVDRVRAGDRAALDVLVRRHYAAIERIVRVKFRVSGADAEDMIQDAALLLSRKVAAWRDENAFPAFVYRLATNVVLARLRTVRFHKHRVMVRVVEALEEGMDARAVAVLSDPRGTADELLIEREQRAALARAVDGLPPGVRAYFTAHYGDGKRLHEIASEGGVPEVTVRTRVHRGRELVRKACAPDDDEDDDGPHARAA